MNISTVRELAQEFKSGPWAWPGGYPKYLTTSDGGALCWGCCRAEYGLIAADLRSGNTRSGWHPAGVDINWEDTTLYCDHCGACIESAYGDADENSEEIEP